MLAFWRLISFHFGLLGLPKKAYDSNVDRIAVLQRSKSRTEKSMCTTVLRRNLFLSLALLHAAVQGPNIAKTNVVLCTASLPHVLKGVRYRHLAVVRSEGVHTSRAEASKLSTLRETTKNYWEKQYRIESAS